MRKGGRCGEFRSEGSGGRGRMLRTTGSI